MTKKVLSLILAMMLMLSCCVTLTAAADVIELSTTRETKIEAEDWSNNYDPETGDIPLAGGGTYLSFNPNEWVQYNIKVPVAGKYRIGIFMATPGASVTYDISIDGTTVYKTPVSGTTSFFDFQLKELEPITLAGGQHIIRFKNVDTGNHFDYFTISYIDPDDQGASAGKVSGSYKSRALPTVIEAEDYDLGETGSYSKDGKNNGNAYRPKDKLDIFASKDGGYYVKLAEGEHARYSFDVKVAGYYTLYTSASAQGAGIITVNGLPYEIKAEFSNTEKKACSIYLPVGTHYVEVKPSSRFDLSFDYLRFQSEYKPEEYFTLDALSKPVDEDAKVVEEEHPVYANLYVSVNGSDDNDGSKEKPFKTINKAKETAAKMSSAMTGDIIVNIDSGTYFLEETEVFEPKHSGQNGFDIIYRGTDKNNLPRISGGVDITGWEKHTDKIWKASVDSVEEIRNLYVNDFPATRARTKYMYVNTDFYDDPDTKTMNDGMFVKKQNFIREFKRPQDIEILFPIQWNCHFLPVEDIIVPEDGEYVTIKMKQPYFDTACTFTAVNALIVKKGEDFYMENAYEFLDEPGEFYFDRGEKVVYYYPESGINMQTAKTTVAKTEGLIDVKGDSIKNKVQNLKFENLAFRYGAWNEVSEKGYITRQAGEGIDTTTGKSYVIHSQVSVNRAMNIDFSGCDFACLGSDALSFVEAVSNSTINGNTFRDLSGSAIAIGRIDHYKNKEVLASTDQEMCCNIDVTNNVIRRLAGEWRGNVPITVYYAKNVNILHNDLSSVPYTAITVGWGWGSRNPEDGGNHKVSYNKIHDVLTSLHDGSHIYTLGALPGSEISYNHLSKTNYSLGGVYSDSGTSYLDIHHNVIDCSDVTTWWYQQTGNTKDNRAYDNYAVSSKYFDSKQGQYRDYSLHGPDKNSMGNEIQSHHVVADGNWPDEAKGIMASAGLEAGYEYLLDRVEMPEGRYCRLTGIPDNLYATEYSKQWYQAEDYKKGGQGIGYYKKTEIFGSAYRPDEGVSLIKNVKGMGYQIDNNNNGEWFAYDIEIPADGEYYLDIFASHGWSDDVTPQPGINVYVDGKLIQEDFDIPRTGWGSNTEMQVGKYNLKAGKHVMKFEWTGEGFYFDAFRIHDGKYYDTLDGTENDASYDEGVVGERKVTSAEEQEKFSFVDCVGHWAEEEILTMYEAGYIKGVSETEFAPLAKVTLKQTALLLMRAISENSDDAKWEQDALRIGIINGNENYNAQISREKFADMIMKAYLHKLGSYDIAVGGEIFADFDDVDSKYATAVRGAKRNGIMQGDENGNFNPKSGLSRAEAAVVVRRLLKK